MSTHPTIFGPYRLEQLLGRGGMGEVHRAHDTEHRRTVAVKRLAPQLADDPEFRSRFRREAHNVAQLSNPHIVPIHRYGEIDGRLYIDMRFVAGGDLDALIRTAGPVPVERAVRMLEQIAGGLDAAHRHGLVHRDVKPSNVLLDGHVPDFCYLADFGITKAATTERSNSLTRSGALLGSLAYMAPEQFTGTAATGSDVYSLTCVFFELITGRKPYAGDRLPALMHAHMKVPPPRPSTHDPGAALFDEVIATGMAKEIGARYASAGELARAARAALEAHRSRATLAPTAAPAADPRPAAPAPPGPTTVAVRTAPVRPRAHPPPVDSAPTVPLALPALDRRPADPPPDPVAALETRPHPPPPAAALPPPPGAPRPDRRRLLPLTAVALIVALVAGVWIIVQQGGTSAPETGTAAPTPGPTPVAAPPPPAGPVITEAVFTGRTGDGRLTLAVGIKDGKAAGYLCDGEDVEAWVEGTISGSQVTLLDRTGQPVITAGATQRSLLGTVTLRGVAQSFAADIAATQAGLYEYRRTAGGITERIGWIVLPDGTQVGIRSQNGVRTPAPPLAPETGVSTVEGRPVRAERLSGTSTVIVG